MVDRRKSRSDKKKVVVALLCFFVGFLGVHRFYVGKVFTGILMIVFAGVWFNIAWLAWLNQDPDIFYGLWLAWSWAIIDLYKITRGRFGDKENRGLS